MDATFRPMDRMELDELDTLRVYGESETQYIDDGEIALCSCGSSHWEAPKP
jgi:hypothetical protein